MLKNVRQVVLQLAGKRRGSLAQGVVVRDASGLLAHHRGHHFLHDGLALDFRRNGCRRDQRRRTRCGYVDARISDHVLDLVGRLQFEVLRLVGNLQHHEVVLSQCVIHVRHVPVLGRDGSRLGNGPECVHVQLRNGINVPGGAIADDAFQSCRIGQCGGVGVDRHDRLNHRAELRDD